MAARDDDLEVVLTDLFRDGQNMAPTYTHIECKIGGVERVTMACRSLSDWLEDNPNASATYMFVNTADCRIARENMGPASAMQPVGTGEQNTISMTTYEDWINEIHKPLENRGHLIFLMDMGFGVRTAEMMIAAMKMLHNMQELLRGRQAGTTITWVSVSYTAQALLSEEAGFRVEALLLPRFVAPMVCNQDRVLAKVDDRQRPDYNWRAAAVDWILDEYTKDPSKRSRPWVIALACIMSPEDAYYIRYNLKVRTMLFPIWIQFIQPWMDAQMIHEAVSSSEGLNIICIDPQVSLIPTINNLKAVILAPVFTAPAFDINTTGIVKKTVSYDVAISLASYLRGFGLRNSGNVDVQVSQGLTRPNSTAPIDFPPPEHKAEISTASDKDFIYINLASIVVLKSYTHPGILSVTVSPSALELDEARRRLEVWRLVERTQDSPISHPRFKLTSPLGKAVSSYVMAESNMHSLVLLGFVKPEMPVRIQQVLLDLAMLISQGLSSFFDLSTAEGQRDHRETIQKFGGAAGFARPHRHKGLLWQAMAYLSCFRKFKRPINWGPEDRPNKVLDEAVRLEALRKVATRVHLWKYHLNIPVADETHKLSDEDFYTVEKFLAAAFAFNFMRVPVEDVGYFGRDITSDVILEREAEGEAVNWDVVKREAREGGDPQAMAIYTHLSMDIVEGDLKVYRAVGTTAISNSAFCNGLMDIGIEHYRSLRPPVRPERRCLVPRGGS